MGDHGETDLRLLCAVCGEATARSRPCIGCDEAIFFCNEHVNDIPTMCDGCTHMLDKEDRPMTDGMDPDDQNPNRAAERAHAIRDFQRAAAPEGVTPIAGVNVGAETAEALKAVVGSKRKLYCIYCAGTYPEGEAHVCPPEEDTTGHEARIATLEQRVDELEQLVRKLLPPDGPPPQTIDRFFP
jgi:hypothetical protein